MSLPRSDAPPPLALSAWAELSRKSPREAALRLSWELSERLSAEQRASVLAQTVPEQALEPRFAASFSPSAGPLSGVPFLVKDLFDVAGMPTRAGSRFLSATRPTPPASSVLVRELEALGAVCAGKTHLHEFAYGITGQNPHFGNVRHPRLADRTSGGSSSGSAAAVGAGIVPFALGTDTGGSIRIPAAFCGLFGYRHVPGHRWIGDAFPLARSCDTAGWFTRSAEDMALLNKALLGPAPEPRRKPRGCYVAWGQLEKEVAESCAVAADRLCPTADLDTLEGLRRVFEGCGEWYSVLTSAEAAAVHADWLDNRKAEYGEAVWRRIDRGRHWTPEAEGDALVRRQLLQATLASYFMTFDFLVLPATPCPALPLRESESYPRERLIEVSAPASLAGLPALTLPVPLDGGLTTGLQVLAPFPNSPAFAFALGVWDTPRA